MMGMERFAGMTLKEKIFQTFVTCSNYIQKEKSIKEYFRKYPVGALYFAKGQVQDLAPQMESGTVSPTALIAECRAASRTPLLVCADGANIEKDGERPSSCIALAAARDAELDFAYGVAQGMQMNYHDIDWILGPCIDMAMCPTSDTISATATDDPVRNGEMYSRVVKGIQSRGVAATVKHFPGLGTHHVNFHYGPGQNVMDMDTWMATYGHSYLECFASGALSVMTSHLTLRAWSEKGDDGHYPIATYSSDITVKLLKEKLGFRGAVVTDALIMGGMSRGDQVEESVQAFKSGADFLLWPPMETADRIEEEILAGRIPMARLDDALSRIAYVRDTLEELRKVPKTLVDPEYVDETFRRAVREGMTKIADTDSILPLSPDKKKKILVVGCAKDEGDMDKLRPIADELRARGFDADFQEYLLLCWQDDMDRLSEKYDVMLICYNVPFTVGVFPKCASTTWSSHLAPREKAVFLNFSSPHFADDYFPEAHAFVNVHSAPTPYAVKEAIARLCGDANFTGSSPVKLAR